jgi:hypothetical protein
MSAFGTHIVRALGDPLFASGPLPHPTRTFCMTGAVAERQVGSGNNNLREKCAICSGCTVYVKRPCESPALRFGGVAKTLPNYNWGTLPDSL